MKKTAVIAGLVSGLLFGMATPFSKILLMKLNSFQPAGLLYLGAGKGHSHLHVHEPQSHNHPHYPDLHHRHGHKTR